MCLNPDTRGWGRTGGDRGSLPGLCSQCHLSQPWPLSSCPHVQAAEASVTGNSQSSCTVKSAHSFLGYRAGYLGNLCLGPAPCRSEWSLPGRGSARPLQGIRTLQGAWALAPRQAGICRGPTRTFEPPLAAGNMGAVQRFKTDQEPGDKPEIASPSPHSFLF